VYVKSLSLNISPNTVLDVGSKIVLCSINFSGLLIIAIVRMFIADMKDFVILGDYMLYKLIKSSDYVRTLFV